MAFMTVIGDGMQIVGCSVHQDMQTWFRYCSGGCLVGIFVDRTPFNMQTLDSMRRGRTVEDVLLGTQTSVL